MICNTINSCLMELFEQIKLFGTSVDKRLYNTQLTILEPIDNALTKKTLEKVLSINWDLKYAKFLWKWLSSEYVHKSKTYKPKDTFDKWFSLRDIKKAFKDLQVNPYRTTWLYQTEAEPKDIHIAAIGFRVEFKHTLEIGAIDSLKMIVTITKGIDLQDFAYYHYCLSELQKKIADTLEIKIGPCDYFISSLYL